MANIHSVFLLNIYCISSVITPDSIYITPENLSNLCYILQLDILQGQINNFLIKITWYFLHFFILHWFLT